MDKNCVTAAAAWRQRQIEDCLLRSMQSTHYSQISVSDLCRQAGISRKAFYRYFGSKDSCMQALLNRVIMDIWTFSAEDIMSDTSAARQAAISRSIEYWMRHNDLLQLLDRNNLLDSYIKQCVQHILREEYWVVRILKRLNDPDEADTLTFVLCGTVSLLVKWSREGWPKSEEEMHEILFRLLCRPLFA